MKGGKFITQIQLDYQKNKETGRHNLATEEQARNELTETTRHNIAGETETNRHNVVTENETNRHNVAGETETHRHNVKTEKQENKKIKETSRHNKAGEKETKRHNKATEHEATRSNKVREAETTRSNQAKESNESRKTDIAESKKNSEIAKNKSDARKNNASAEEQEFYNTVKKNSPELFEAMSAYKAGGGGVVGLTASIYYTAEQAIKGLSRDMRAAFTKHTGLTPEEFMEHIKIGK